MAALNRLIKAIKTPVKYEVFSNFQCNMTEMNENSFFYKNS